MAVGEWQVVPLPMFRWLVHGAHQQRVSQQDGALSLSALRRLAVDSILSYGCPYKIYISKFLYWFSRLCIYIFTPMSSAKVASRKRLASAVEVDDEAPAYNQRSNIADGNSDVIDAAVDSVPFIEHALERADTAGSIPVETDAVIAGSGSSVAISAVSPQRAAPKPETPLSPSNRDRILASFAPVKVNCSLSFAGLSNPNMRFDFQAIVLVVYPMCDKPDRRHLSLIDRFGVTGITVWSNHVAMFSPQSVGLVVKFTNLSVVTHNNKRGLSMNRDSAIRFLSDVELRRSEENLWWSSMLSVATISISSARFLDDDSVVSFSGILFAIQIEVKRVRNEDKELLTLRLADATGHIDVRSWHSTDADFRSFIDKPIQLQRLRVTSYAGNKVAEILDGDNGTVISGVFAGASALSNFWISPTDV